MGDRVERLLEAHKAHIQWLLLLACLVHQYSEILDLIYCPPSLLESRLFVCNFRFCLHSDPFQYDPKKDLACMGDKSNCSVICTLFKITKHEELKKLYQQYMLTANLASMLAPAPTPNPITLRSLLTFSMHSAMFCNATNIKL